jgi:hypothetical protein
MTCNSLTGSLDLPSGEPAGFQGFDPERTKRQLVTAPGISFHLAFLLLSILGFLWL